MTLLRQLFYGVSALFLVLLGGVQAIYLANARQHLEQQLTASAQEAATALSLRLATLSPFEDLALIETLVKPVFDRGYYETIEVVSVTGRMLYRRSLPAAQDDVPGWFMRLFPLRAPGATSLISSGWRELGRVVVVNHPHFAYQQLWSTALETIAWLFAVYLAAMAAVIGFLAMLLRPLAEIERTAVAIGERDFRSIDATPSARELARVVDAMNRLSGAIRRIIEEESARAEALRREAYVDAVTSLYNRRGLEQQLQALWGAETEVHSGALALIEVDGFGPVNARIGYQKGDELLAQIGATLTATCEGRDAVCARLGGASFAVGLVNIESEALRALVGSLCARLEAMLVEQGLLSELRFHCGVTHRSGTLPEVSALLASADHAIERARAKGADEFDVEEFDEQATAGSRAWRMRIERAIEADHFALYAQDVLGLPGGAPVHREITLRMTEDGEPLAAAEFLPMATRHGLVPRLDVRVLEKLFDHVGARGAPATDLALNVSARTIADRDALGRILALLDGRADLARRLVFEMTEFGAMQDQEATRRFAAELRRRGARFAMDNFGMHHDSLLLVHALAPHYIKLAPGYARELSGNQDMRFYVESIVRIARPMEVGVFAQAVEDAALVPLLAEMGLGGYQGYAAARPAPLG
jgi:diguanylate cyclase (GGDEF)-like protein